MGAENREVSGGHPLFSGRRFRRDPNCRTAIYELSRLLISQGHHERVLPFQKRFDDLQELRKLEEKLSQGHSNAALLRKTADKMESLGRVWEAWGWCLVALERKPS